MSRSFRTTDVLILPMSRRGAVDMDSAQLLDIDRLTAAGAVTIAPVVSESGRTEVAVTATPLADLTRSTARDLLAPKVVAAREALAPRVEHLQETLVPKVLAAREAAVERLAPAADVTREKLVPAAATARDTVREKLVPAAATARDTVRENLVPAAATARDTVRETVNTTVSTAMETAVALREGREVPASRSPRIPRPFRRPQPEQTGRSPLLLLAGLPVAVGVAVALRRRAGGSQASFAPEPYGETAAAPAATTGRPAEEPRPTDEAPAAAAPSATAVDDGQLVDGVPHLSQAEQDDGPTS